MNRGQLRAGLRRMCQDTANEQWSDDELNETLNHSLQSVQEFILMLDPEAFAVWETRSVTKDERYYLRPVDIIYDFELGFSSDPAKSDYAPLTRRPFQELREGDGGRSYTEASAAGVYAKIGSYYYLGWNPDKDIADGLQVIYTPWLVMDEDEDVPAISLGFHRILMVDAAIKILQDTPEDTAKLEKERSEFLEKIIRYYRSSSTSPDTISLDVAKGYSLG